MNILIRPALTVTGRGKLTILIYHRVHRVVDALFPGAADARRFDEQMSWIASALNVIALDEAIDRLRQRRLPPRAASITFDDGYADNAEVALPILRRHGLSATFFVATGYLDGGRMWNDTVIEVVRRAPDGDLDLGALGLGRFPVGTAASRRVAIDAIIARTKYLPSDARRNTVDALAAMTNGELPGDLMMRSEQVRELHRAGMGIGAHTVTHPILARIGDNEALAEIRDGRRSLESLIGEPVTLFAYPNGRPTQDYGAAHVAMVRELGFAAAVSTSASAADATSDPFQLPRFTPWGQTSSRFALGLARNHLGHYRSRR